jgi:pimeloyl-ACP methyl ester carboxylesterase
MRYTVSPLIGAAMMPRVNARIFNPAPVPSSWIEGFPFEMSLRPFQIRSEAAEAAMMIPAAARLTRRYGDLRVPAAIMAGGGDRMVDSFYQSERLHREVPASTFRVVPEVGHMIHHIVPRRVMAAIHEAATVIEPERLRRRASAR